MSYHSTTSGPEETHISNYWDDWDYEHRHGCDYVPHIEDSKGPDDSVKEEKGAGDDS